MAERFSLGGALKAAFGFWGRGVRATAGILTLATLALAWLQYIAGVARDGGAIDQQLQGVALSGVSLIALLASVALYRAYFSLSRPNEPELTVGPQGFQIGRSEASAFVATFLQGVLLFLLSMLLVVGLAASFVAVAASSGQAPPTTAEGLSRFMGPLWPPSQRWLPVMAYVAGASLLAAWIFTRLSLSLAASVAERRIRVLSTWGLTKGLFWKMLVGKGLIALPVIAIGLFQTYWLEPLLGALHLGAASRDASAMTLLAGAAVSVFYQMPLMAGFNAYLYDCVGPTPSTEAKSS